MILYPFPPGSPTECSITGFDEEKKEPAAELYLLAPGSVPPADFGGGYLFCETHGCCSLFKQQCQMPLPSGATRKFPAAVWKDTCADCSRSGAADFGCILRLSVCCFPFPVSLVSECRLTKPQRTH